ncbi:MAG TPA: sulfate adenylyltransferase subunit CysN [Marinobacterium sp.]|nr:sulfate adenylyltransferase subunit CysN [Marinobacterium sp.]
MNQEQDLIARDIEGYLALHENKELLRFITCGSVDDGKSTLIGRLLHDSKMIYEDQLAAVRNDSKRVGTTGDDIDLALLVDGLQAEREQGITIDVAYRYFSTTNRKFIIADTPGHEQYTRNMATGASTADLAIILIDARHGVQTQTRRHSFIVSLLGIKHTVIAINKMDLVGYSEARFNQIREEYLDFARSLDLSDLHFVPLSALKGDNVVAPSEQMKWYRGTPLLAQLETIKINRDSRDEPLRFPVQYVNRPHLDFRGYAGTIASGTLSVGDEVQVLPSGKRSRVKQIVTWDGNLTSAYAQQSVTLTLEDEIDISRGDMLVHADQHLVPQRNFNAHLVWMSDQPLVTGRSYALKLASSSTTAVVNRIHQRIDVNTLERSPSNALVLNEIAEVEISVESPVVVDDYQRLRQTGAFILIDRLTNGTVAAGMVTLAEASGEGIQLHTESAVTSAQRAARLGQQAKVIALPGADADLLFTLERALFDRGRLAVIAQPEHYAPLLDAGLIVLSREVNEADWVASADQNADLYVNARLETAHRVELIIDALERCQII